MRKLRAATADNVLLSKALRRLMEGKMDGRHAQGTGSWVLTKYGTDVQSVDGDQESFDRNVPLTSMERK